MAPHTRFKLAVIRTMRCDFCNNSNVDGLQECIDCNMHICRVCVENGKLNNDKKHKLRQNAIDNLNWSRPPRSRRAATHRRATTVSESASPVVLSKQERRQARDERHLLHHSDHGNGPHLGTGTHHGTGNHHESASQFRRILPKPQQNVETLPTSGFNVSGGNHEHTGHGHFQFASAHPGFPPGYAPSFPTHAMPYGGPPSGPGQHGPQPSQGGLAMPMGPIYGHHFSANPGLHPHGDPRLHTPPGQQFAQSGYPVPSNFGGYYGGHPMAYSPAPTPPGFAGPGFPQHVSQPPAMYSDGGYIPYGSMPPGQPGPGPIYVAGQPYGGGPFPHAAIPPQEQRPPCGQGSEPARAGQISRPAEIAREAQAREPTLRGHADQPLGPSSIEEGQQQQQQAWEREQAQQAWEQQRTRQELEHQQAQQAIQHMFVQSQQQAVQQNPQPVAHQQQWQEWEQHKTQPTGQQASQTAPQAQKQNEQRQQQPVEQQPQQQAARPISEGGAISGPYPFTASRTNASPLTLPPITAPSITTSSAQKAQAPDSVAPAPPLPTLEPDPNSSQLSLSGLQLREAHAATPSVVGYAQRPFGIPALARDLYAGRPSYYDEAAARWAEFQSLRARWASQGDEEEYNDETEAETDGTIGTYKGTGPGPAQPGRSLDQPFSRGQKRSFSQTSSVVDSTLSAELDHPVAAAAVPSTEALRRKLHDDADIVRARREGGERAALDMAAAANTLQGGGRGLGGVADAQVVANDREILRRQDDIDRQKNSGRAEGAVEVPNT